MKTDGQLQHDVSEELKWEVQVMVAAADSVRFLVGVTGVSDQIAIKPSLSVSRMTLAY